MNYTARVGSNTLVVFVAKGLTLSLGLLFTIVLARAFGGEIFGLFSFSLAFVTLFSVFVDFGLHPIVVREFAQVHHRKREIYATALLLKVGLIACTLVLLYSVVLIIDFGTLQKRLIVILSMVFVFSSKVAGLRGIIETPYQAELRMLLPSILQILDVLIGVTLLVLLLKFNASISWAAFIYVISNIPGFLILTKNSTRLVAPEWGLDVELFKTVIKEAYPIAIYTAGLAIFTNLDILLLKYFSTDTQLGLYAAASRLINPLTFLPFAIVASLFPLMSKYSSGEVKRLTRLLHSGLKLMLFAGILITLLGLIWGNEIIAFLFGQNFTNSVFPFKILVGTTCFLFLNFLMVDFNIATGRQKINQMVVIVLVLSNLALNIFLIPQWGIKGASMARLICLLVGTTLYFASSKEFLDTPFFKNVLKLSMVGVGCLLIILILKPNPWLSSAVIIPGYALMSFFLKIFDREEIDLAHRLIRRPIFN